MPENNHNEHVLLKCNGSTDEPIETGIIRPQKRWTKCQTLHFILTILLLLACIGMILFYVFKVNKSQEDCDVQNAKHHKTSLGQKHGKNSTKAPVSETPECARQAKNCSKGPVCKTPKCPECPKHGKNNAKTPVCETAECVLIAAQVLTTMNNKVNPCDNFYEYACGGWKKENNIPTGHRYYDRFMELIESRDEMLKNRLEDDKPNSESPAEVELYKLYSSCTFTQAKEALGLQPLKDVIVKLGSCKALNDSWEEKTWDLSKKLAEFHEVFNPVAFLGIDAPLFDMRVVVDIKDSTNNIIKIGQPKQPGADGNRAQLQPESGGTDNSAFRMMELLSGKNVSIAMKKVQALESELAKAILPSDKLRIIQNSRQRITVKELIAATKNSKLNWLEYLNQALGKTGIKITESTEIATQPLNYLKKMAEVIDKTSKTTLGNYLVWLVVRQYEMYISEKARKVRWMTLSNEKWKKCMQEAHENMGMALGNIFVREKFKDEDKKKVEEMIRNIRNSFLTIVRKTKWMDEKTKKTVIKKGEALIGNIAYPPFIKDPVKLGEYYKGLSFKKETYFKNMLQMKMNSKTKNIMRLKAKVDRAEWELPPTMVNAFYDSGRNKMIFMAAILQSPLFNINAPMTINYGGIGVVMGHELAHGFDDQGRLFDEKGNLKLQWSEQSIKAYNERVQCLKDQYSQYSIYNTPININNTIGENIADNSGMRTAYEAYRKLIKENGAPKRLPGIEMTDDQLFFLASAQVWCSKETESLMKDKLKYGAHSPAVFRVRGGLSNMKEFARAYNCALNSPTNPEKKCTLW